MKDEPPTALWPLLLRARVLVDRMTETKRAAFGYHGDDQHSVETEDLACIETVASLMNRMHEACPLVPRPLYDAANTFLDDLEECVREHELRTEEANALREE